MEFDTQVEPIYAMMRPKLHITPPPLPVEKPELVKEIMALRGDSAEDLHEERMNVPGGDRVLSVLNTGDGSSFEVPLVLGSFLSPPSSPGASNDEDESSDWEGITIESDSESEYSGPSGGPVSSSEEEEDSDIEMHGPSRVMDPIISAVSLRRRKAPVRPARPDTPSIYSVLSVSEASLPSSRPLPRESLIPLDVFEYPYTHRVSQFPVSPLTPASPMDFPSHPPLRSRFSTSTLNSIPEPPNTASSSFFSRLRGRSSKTPSNPVRAPSKTESLSRRPSNPSSPRTPSRGTRKASYMPPSPAPSSFSYSSRSSLERERDLDSDACSCVSGTSSTGSNGLRRPPIPIELFIKN